VYFLLVVEYFVVRTSAVDYLERLASEMTYYVLLNFAPSVTHWWCVCSLPASVSDAVQWECCVCLRHRAERMDSVSTSEESQL